ncbi:hypothetical protein B0H14DRAFT_3576135, partial [Mycena olivaceomarginata]
MAFRPSQSQNITKSLVGSNVAEKDSETPDAWVVGVDVKTGARHKRGSRRARIYNTARSPPPLSTAHLIPDVLPPSFAPTALLTILLPSGPVASGAEVPISETVEAPKVAITAAPKEEDVGADGLVKNLAQMDPSTHSQCSTPDAPSAAAADESTVFGIGWLRSNETGLTPDPDPTFPVVQAKPAPAAEPTPYRPPGPPKGSGAAS